MNVTFITGNQNKADYLARHLGFSVKHQKVELDELQSLDLAAIARHKALQAYDIVRGPVLVEDVGLECTAFGRLPGPFVKWFLEEMSLEQICRLLDGKDRTAVARCAYAYYDGKGEPHVFVGSLNGAIAEHPAGSGGYGWDKIFIPEGYGQTRAELSPEDDRKTYLQIRDFDGLRGFLRTRHPGA